MDTREKILLWIRAVRAPFFSATVMSSVIAGALAFSEGSFNWFYFIGAALVIAGSNCGINLINDYFDHKSGNDEINKYPTPFSGGSRVIQEGLIKPRSILAAGIICFSVVTIFGLYFVIFVNLHLLWFGLAAVILGYFYTGSPVRLVYRGVGEIFVFIKSGPLAVCGTYLLFTDRITAEALLISIPQGLLIAAILFINEFPDYEADRTAGKMHIVARIGRKKSRYYYAAVIALAYLSVIIPVILGIFPLWLLITLATLPLAVKSVHIAFTKYDDEQAILPAQAGTIILTLAFGLSISIGYMLDRFF